MEKLLYFWVDKSHKRATISTGIRANWTNCLLYILKVLLNLHNFPLLNINCTEPYLGPLYISYMMAQVFNCTIPERVLPMEQYAKGFERFHAGEDVRPVTSCTFLCWSNRVSIFEPYVCTLCHETHENTTEASDHAPQVAEIFIGFSNSFFRKSITGASLFDLTSILLISVDGKYVLFWSHTSWHSNLSFKNTCGAGKTDEPGWPWGRGT